MYKTMRHVSTIRPIETNRKMKQDSIHVGCVFQWPTLDVCISGGLKVGYQENKFEQVSSDDHQMSLAGGKGSSEQPTSLMSRGEVGGVPQV